MIMWAMSDRAIPRILPDDGRLRRPHLPAGQRQGPLDLRQVPLAPEARHAVRGLGRGAQDQRRRSRLPSPRSVGGHRRRRFPGVGTRPADLHPRSRPTASTSMCSTPPSSFPEEMIPMQLIGRMVLDRNPDNFFAETEQVAFCAANVVPGIDFTNDPLMQGRLFSYLDTQLKRLGGPNFHQIPINAPKCPFHNLQRDGHMQMEVPLGRVNYEPNSLGARRAARIRRRASDLSRRRGGRPAAHPRRTLRRPLFPGAAVLLSQTEPEQNHIVRRPDLRTEQMSGSPRSRSGPVASGPYRRDIGRAGRARAWACSERSSRREAPVARPDMAPSPALSILAKAKPTSGGPQGRLPGHRRLRRRAGRRARSRGRRRPARSSRSSPRRSAA